MEKQPEDDNRVQISRAVFDGLEFIRRSGATNMLDRPMVLNLAKEWGFPDTVDWIESVDTGTYGRLIFQGPDVIEDDPPNQAIESELNRLAPENEVSSQVAENEGGEGSDEIDVLDQATDDERARMRDMIIALSKHATLTVADTYETEQMGVLIDPVRRALITAERIALNRNLAEAS
jgi:hypothetical protein